MSRGAVSPVIERNELTIGDLARARLGGLLSNGNVVGHGRAMRCECSQRVCVSVSYAVGPRFSFSRFLFPVPCVEPVCIA